jgi:hypothetical protein
MELFVIRAWGELIDAMFSDDERRRMWASDRILSSWIARDSPLAPARRSTRLETRAPARFVFRFEEKLGETVLERDGKSIPVRRYDCGDDCLDGEAAPPAVLIEHEHEHEHEPLQTLPAWPGPGLPPPLVARLYAPYSPKPPLIHREPPSSPRPAVLRRRLRGVE